MSQHQGSPPPMRGKAAHDYCDWHIGGITPAHAGKRLGHSPILRVKRDHPRPCGEKHLHLRHIIVGLGSPPPMRGKGTRLPLGLRRKGITHAHAGKSPPPLGWADGA